MSQASSRSVAVAAAGGENNQGERGGAVSVARHGLPDMGLVSAAEMADTVASLRERTDLPLQMPTRRHLCPMMTMTGLQKL